VNQGALQVNEKAAADWFRDGGVPKNGHPLIEPPSDRQHQDCDRTAVKLSICILDQGKKRFDLMILN
jgi:hypothetical protein